MKICRWLLLFQEFKFEVVVQSSKANIGLDHLSRMESDEESTRIDDDLPDAHLFRIKVVPTDLAEIA